MICANPDQFCIPIHLVLICFREYLALKILIRPHIYALVQNAPCSLAVSGLYALRLEQTISSDPTSGPGWDA